MMEMQKHHMVSSHRWWFDSHSSSKRSPWLQSTLSELDEKTEAMLKLIEEDADSFAQRAEMYYKKRPELINRVGDFYRAHRSLAERYDSLKSDSGTRVLTHLGFLSPFKKSHSERSMSVIDQTYSNYSDTSEDEESAESEVEDPEQEHEIQVNNDDESLESEVEDPEQDNDDDSAESEVEGPKQDQIWVHKLIDNTESETMKMLREELERLRDENKIQKEQLMEKDEEKREVIRQLSLAVGVLKDENLKLKQFIATTKDYPKKRDRFEFSKLKERFLGTFFNEFGKSQPSVVAL